MKDITLSVTGTKVDFLDSYRRLFNDDYFILDIFEYITENKNYIYNYSYTDEENCDKLIVSIGDFLYTITFERNNQGKYFIGLEKEYSNYYESRELYYKCKLIVPKKIQKILAGDLK